MSPPAVARVVRLGGLAGTGHQTGPGWTGTPAPPATSPQAGTDRPALPHPAGRVPAHLPDPRLGGLKRARRKTQKRQHVGLSFRIKRTTGRLRQGPRDGRVQGGTNSGEMTTNVETYSTANSEEPKTRSDRKSVVQGKSVDLGG